MKRFLILVAGLFSTTLTADSTTFSAQRLSEFYDEFGCEEKQLLADAGLTSTCYNSTGLSLLPDPPPVVPVSPPGPPTPPPPMIPPLLPVTIVNNSGNPDSDVFVLVQGRVPIGGPQVFVDFTLATPGVGTLHDVVVGDNGSTYTLPLTSAHFVAEAAPHTYTFYLPMIDSFIVLLSFNQALNIPVIAGPKIQDPAFNNPQDPNNNFSIIWDQGEGAYVNGSPMVNVDATAVSFFSIPLYVTLSTGTPFNACGLTQSRSAIIGYLQSVFATVPPAPESAQWSGLPIPGGGTVYRILSPGNAMSAGFFDENYLNNPTAYGYSYLSDVWSNITSFYRRNPGTLSIQIPNGLIYTGTVQSDNSILFTSGGNTVTFAPPTNGPPYTSSTSYNIFSGLNLFSSATSGADAIQVSKAFEEAIIAGIVPTTSPINATLPTQLQNFMPYYQINKNLSPRGQTTGPWYSLYSQALHACGMIYSYAFDEPLWPGVLLGSPTLIVGSTYIGITIGNSQ
jgi:hypothetical protein